MKMCRLGGKNSVVKGLTILLHNLHIYMTPKSNGQTGYVVPLGYGGHHGRAGEYRNIISLLISQ